MKGEKKDDVLPKKKKRISQTGGGGGAEKMWTKTTQGKSPKRGGCQKGTGK